MKPDRKDPKVKKARTELLFLKRLPKNRKKALRVKKEIRVKPVPPVPKDRRVLKGIKVIQATKAKPVQLEQQDRKVLTEKLR